MNILITGGAGFIGINAARYFSKKNHKVFIFDNFSRLGGKKNIAWLKKELGYGILVIEGDVRDRQKVDAVVKKSDAIIHLAGQVAVTSSVLDPREDFESNALGTFNILESARKQKTKPIVFYSSTNKVYGGLEDLKITETQTRYRFLNLPKGVSEKRGIDFHSPYGCSKGAADQYVRDYYRIYDLPTVVFRQSCIYGMRQFGVEDQGWIAWFMIALSQNKEITIFGSGKQVRDVLYIDDLLGMYEKSLDNINKTKGEIFNVGGGMRNSLSIWYEFKPILDSLFERDINARFRKTRPGDQPIYISDITKAKNVINWEPKTSFKVGIPKLYKWISLNPSLFMAT